LPLASIISLGTHIWIIGQTSATLQVTLRFAFRKLRILVGHIGVPWLDEMLALVILSIKTFGYLQGRIESPGADTPWTMARCARASWGPAL
jgi:hypothetical protein